MNKKFVIPYSEYSRKNKKIYESIESLNLDSIDSYFDLIDYNFVSNKKLSTFLYRGISDVKSNYILIDSTNYVRLPKTGNGLYNSWIDGSPDWKEYPKRVKSIIVSTHKYTAHYFSGKMTNDYENTFLILPLRKTINEELLYGICPTMDIWGSFDEILQEYEFNHTDYTITNLFDDLGLYLNLVMDKTPQEIKYPKFDVLVDWLDELQSILENPNEEQQENIDEILRMHHNSYGYDAPEPIFNILKDGGILRIINSIMNPNSNNFRLENLDYIVNTLHKENSEIWFEGKAIGISIQHLEQFLNKRIEQLNIQDILDFVHKSPQ